jgi:hypothetical protein
VESITRKTSPFGRRALAVAISAELAVTILQGGTFAWQSFNEQYKEERNL